MNNTKLHWQEIAMILTIYEESINSGIISRYGDSSQLQSISEYILTTFNLYKDSLNISESENNNNFCKQHE